jgi:hypothetical protein
MTTRAKLSLALVAGVLLNGCAMTPDEQDRFRANFMQGLSAGQQARPVHQVPVYQMPLNRPQYQQPINTTCRRNAWDGSVNCTSW